MYISYEADIKNSRKNTMTFSQFIHGWKYQAVPPCALKDYIDLLWHTKMAPNIIKNISVKKKKKKENAFDSGTGKMWANLLKSPWVKALNNWKLLEASLGVHQ